MHALLERKKINMVGVTAKVRAILTRLSIVQPPIEVEAIAKHFGIKLIPYEDFPDHVSGLIARDQNAEEEVLYIGYNSKHAKVRQRFTIAHELGHFLSGHDDKKIIEDTFDKDTLKEKEANEFAAELLMPKDMITEDMKTKKFDIPALARRYVVSEQAMAIRLLQSGLLNKF